MDLISNKRTRSQRSGRTGGAPAQAPGVESCIQELLSASEYCAAVVQEFWRTAAFTKANMEKMKSEMEIMSGPAMKLDKLWLEQVGKKVKEYRANFRKGASQDFEALAYKHICNLTELVLEIQCVTDLKKKGFETLLDPLQSALESFSGPEVEKQKASLREWFANLQGEFSIQAFMDELAPLVDQDSDVSWPELGKKFERIRGMEPPQHLVAALKKVTPTLFHDLAQKVGLRLNQ